MATIKSLTDKLEAEAKASGLSVNSQSYKTKNGCLLLKVIKEKDGSFTRKKIENDPGLLKMYKDLEAKKEKENDIDIEGTE